MIVYQRSLHLDTFNAPLVVQAVHGSAGQYPRSGLQHLSLAHDWFRVALVRNAGTGDRLFCFIPGGDAVKSTTAMAEQAIAGQGTNI